MRAPLPPIRADARAPAPGGQVSTHGRSAPCVVTRALCAPCSCGSPGVDREPGCGRPCEERGRLSGYLVRRSLVSMSALAALLLVGGTAMVLAGAPAALPLVLSVVVVGGQYALGPALVRWLVPAAVV